MKFVKLLTVATIVVGALSAASASFAVDEYNVSTGTTLDGLGVALRGDDAVALATGLKVTPGRAEYTVEHDGVAYYFASRETMRRFAVDPERYAPQYGGFCAFGVAIGKKLDASPRFADIVDGKLYVFLNALAFEKYEDNKAGTLAQAEANWPTMRHIAVAKVNNS
ncbi:MAG: YHS domain-containing protein [Kiloniellales bacterium]|nr:YHS domain-containing protein [Kiloniellales bacterium]